MSNYLKCLITINIFFLCIIPCFSQKAELKPEKVYGGGSIRPSGYTSVRPGGAKSQGSIRPTNNSVVKKDGSSKIGSSGIQMNMNPVQTNKKNSVKSKPVVKNNRPSAHIDTVYSLRSLKQNGWFMPSQIIEKKDLQYYGGLSLYRFTNKNKEGHWLKVEYIDNRGNLQSPGWYPYIYKIDDKHDTNGDQNWKEKLSEASYVTFVSDASGENVVQERTYNPDDELVYSFSVIPVMEDNKKVYIGSYNDFYGLPAEMRQNQGYAYGTLVKIVRDKWGNDSVVQHIDSRGFPRPNSDMAYKEVFVRDKYGELLENKSYDKDGKMMLDACGNCGVEYKYDKNHNVVQSTYMDEYWRPMVMESDGGKIRTNYKYDKYNRQIEEWYSDAEGHPTPNRYGAYKIVYEYDKFGNVTCVSGLDCDGNPAAYNKDLCAKYVCIFNDNGQILEYHQYDANMNPLELPNYYSSMFWSYDSHTDDHVHVKCYFSDGGVERLAYEKGENEEKWYEADRSYRIKIYDDNNRLLSDTFYSKDGVVDKIKSSYTQYDVNLKSLKENKNPYLSESVIRSQYIDEDGFNEGISSLDSKYDIQKLYAENNLLVSIYGLQSNDRSHLLRQDDLNTFGIVTRSGGQNGVRYYHANIVPTVNEQMNWLYGTDEFREPDYICCNDGTLYCSKQIKSVNEDLYYDEDNKIISDFGEFADKTPKYFSVEVTDENAYDAFGIYDNDIVLSYCGKSFNPNSDVTEFKNQGACATINTANRPKELVVYHLDPATLKSEIRTINLPEGHLNDLGIQLHCTFKTKRQVARMDSTMKANHFSIQKSIIQDIHPALIARLDGFRYEQASDYYSEVGKSAYILAMQIPDYTDFFWTADDAIEVADNLLDGRRMINNIYDNPKLRLWVTTDGTTIDSLEINDQMDPIFSVAEVDDEILGLLRAHAKSIDKDSFAPSNISLKNFKYMKVEEMESLFEYACLLYQSGLTNVSYPIIKSLSEAGYNVAYSLLSVSYLKGHGIKRNLKQAIKWALKAHSEKYDYALVSLIQDYIENSKFKEAKNLIDLIEEESYYYDAAQMFLGDILAQSDTEAALEHYLNALCYANSLSKGEFGGDKGLIKRMLAFPNKEEISRQILNISLQAYNMDNPILNTKGVDMARWLYFDGYGDAASLIALCYFRGIGVEENKMFAKEFALECYNNGNNGPLFNIGREYYSEKEWKNAWYCYNHCKDDDNFYFDANYMCGKIYAMYPDSRSAINKALDYYNNALMIEYNWSNEDIKNCFDEMAEELVKYHKDYPKAAPGLFFVGFDYMRNNEYAKAYEYMKLSGISNPDIYDEYTYFGRNLYKLYHYTQNFDSSEYFDFINTNTLQYLNVPGYADSLSESGISKGYVLAVDGWNLSNEAEMGNVYDLLDSEGSKHILILTENGLEMIEIEASNVDSRNFRYDHMTSEEKDSLRKDYNDWKRIYDQ